MCIAHRQLSMTNQKTRNQLVDVARQLFARDGVENTTMNDIAVASQKGRRTLYTYFKCKEDVYMAVVESELDKLFDRMKVVGEKNIAPDEKFVELIFTHLEAVKETVYRNGTLRGRFFRDIWNVEKVRKVFDQREIALFTEVLEDGVKNGVFNIERPEMLAVILHCCVKGLEVPYTRGLIGVGTQNSITRKYVKGIIYGALGCNKKD